MPRSKQAVKRLPVNVDSLKTAIDDVLKRQFSVGKAARNNLISKTTLLRHLKAHSLSNNDEFCYISKIKCKQVFTEQEEQMLVDYLLMAGKLHYGLSKQALAILAYQFGSANKKTMPPKWSDEGKAGNEWVRCFLSRHTHISLRKPEATSLSRATSFNRTNVSAFFTNLKSCYDRFHFTPDKIYNLDETGNSTVHNPPKILAQKGQKQIGSLTSGERGMNITMIAAVNGVGNHIPPMLIFPRVFYKDHMLKGAPPGSVGSANKSGWSNETIFLDYLKHFIAAVKPTQEEKVLIIMDNHETHITVPAINLAKENGIVLLTMPPHTSHKLQPLDRTVFGPYKTYYGEACNDWMVNHPGKTISIYDVSELVGKAFAKAFTITNIIKGFAVTGICPYNEDVFGDDEFLSSYVTDRPYGENEIACYQNNSQNEEPEAGPSGIGTIAKSTLAVAKLDIVSPEVVRPFPKAPPRKQIARTRTKGKTRVLTDTPIKNEIEEQKLCKNIRPITQSKIKNIKRKILVDTSSSSSEEDLQVVLEDSSSDEEFLANLRKDPDAEETNQPVEEKEITKGDYVLVKLTGKKSVGYFVAEIVDVLEDGYNVLYYKRILGTTALRNFVPSTETSFVHCEDVIMLLPRPTKVGTSNRQAGQISFNVEFSNYKML